MGVVRLRLARFGSRNRSFWRIVAIDSRQARDNMPLEYVRVARGTAQDVVVCAPPPRFGGAQAQRACTRP